jgi:hypothetical protein
VLLRRIEPRGVVCSVDDLRLLVLVGPDAPLLNSVHIERRGVIYLQLKSVELLRQQSPRHRHDRAIVPTDRIPHPRDRAPLAADDLSYFVECLIL